MLNIDKEQEIWRTYPEYDFIEVSNLGKVRTKDRYVKVKGRGKRLVKGRLLKQYPNEKGYMQVHFNVNGKTVNLKVHRMVAITFISNPHKYPEVNHKDNNPSNNTVSNLEWCTRKYNDAYKKNFGTSQAELFGKPVFAVDLRSGKILRFESQHEAARQLGVNQASIWSVLKGELNQTGGYWFTEDESEITDKKIQEIKANMQPCPVIAVNPETSEVFWFESQHEAARQLGVRVGHVNDVLKGRYNQTGGYWSTNADENAVEKTRKKFGDDVARKVEELIN